MPKPIVITLGAEFNIPLFEDGYSCVVLVPTESITIPVEVGADVTFTLRVAEIRKSKNDS